MRQLLYIIITFLFFVSCANRPKPSPKEIALRKFITKFKILKLPVTITPYGNLDDTLNGFYTMPEDTIPLKEEVSSGHFVPAKPYGLLPDTLNCFHLLWIYPNDVDEPILTTYSKTGEKISEEDLIVGNCHTADAPCAWCNESVIIHENYTVYCADTLNEGDCDNDSISVIYKTGIIPHLGKPIFTEEKKKKIK
jgi:hypothetical protein